ncbi:MAG: hypothetical protein NTZ17_06320 [Phycisphaerae bacterium]|nr:hypothetical protein [Phycisphaerae bacterium]
MNNDTAMVNKIVSRRQLLKQAGTGMAATVLSTAVGKVLAQGTPSISGKTPISLIIDDGAPVDPLFYELPGYETPLLVPREFTQRVVETFDRFDLRGKFTVIPMPSCLGRIDQSLKRVPAEHLADWLKLVREGIAPRFDITPEFLTHMQAYNLKTGGFQHLYEDFWISGAPIKEIVEYFVLAFQILKNVGLPATGITSPWVSGIDVEKKYAQALADAQWQVFERKLTWYFLHATSWDAPRQCSIEYEDKTRGQVVVSVPANTPDIFWSMDFPTHDERQTFIKKGIDRLVSADGRTGRIPQLLDSGHPVVLVTHWQSLYTQGTGLGLEGLGALAERIQKVFGNSLQWMSCSELARQYVDTIKPKTL